MGEGAEERCKVVFLREQALLQSYFSSQVTADQSVAMSVARLVWRDWAGQIGFLGKRAPPHPLAAGDRLTLNT